MVKQEIRVYIEDTDAGGIVYYANYLKFMERVRTDLMRSLGYQHVEAMAAGYQYVVGEVSLKYRAPAVMDDIITVTAKPIKVGKARVVLQQQVLKDEQLLVEGEISIACISTEGRPTAMPVDHLAGLKKMLPDFS